jgi:hypothetical protein
LGQEKGCYHVSDGVSEAALISDNALGKEAVNDEFRLVSYCHFSTLDFSSPDP